MRIEGVEDLVSYRVVAMSFHKGSPSPFTLSGAGDMGHKHTKVLFELFHVCPLAGEKRPQSLIIHDCCKDLVYENSDPFISTQLFKYGAWEPALRLRCHRQIRQGLSLHLLL